MKTASLTALVGCLIVLFVFSTQAQPISIELPDSQGNGFVVDYGILEEGTEDKNLTQKSFKVSNTGNSPVKILSMNSDCACLSATSSEQMIEPGASVVITLSYNNRRLGPFHRELILATDASGQEEIKIMAKGQVNLRPE